MAAIRQAVRAAVDSLDMRVGYLLRKSGADYESLRRFVETDVDDVMKLFRVFNDATHGDAGALDMNALHALKRRVEGAIRFLSAIVRPCHLLGDYR